MKYVSSISIICQHHVKEPVKWIVTSYGLTRGESSAAPWFLASVLPSRRSENTNAAPNIPRASPSETFQTFARAGNELWLNTKDMLWKCSLFSKTMLAAVEVYVKLFKDVQSRVQTNITQYGVTLIDSNCRMNLLHDAAFSLSSMHDLFHPKQWFLSSRDYMLIAVRNIAKVNSGNTKTRHRGGTVHVPQGVAGQTANAPKEIEEVDLQRSGEDGPRESLATKHSMQKSLQTTRPRPKQ